MSLLSITESPNELTEDIDISDSKGILKSLSQTDSQIFNGYDTHRGLKEIEFIEHFRKALVVIRTSIKESIRNNEILKIIISGAGTSGRLAMLLAMEFNAHYRKIVGYDLFDFLIAGGNLALIKFQEGAEDDPIKGMEELEKITKNCDRYIYVGITCGLSAHYISGQIYHTVINKKQPAFLIGFNPLEKARTVKPENWDRSFADVIQSVKEFPEMIFLNPIIGPEPITGSTRMKGGTATKIIVESLFYMTLTSLSREMNIQYDDLLNIGRMEDFEHTYYQVIAKYENAKDKTYDWMPSLVPILDQAGRSLNNRGHIYYLGEGMAGKLGIVDASECPPTYGADFHDVRGFIENGWTSFCPQSTDYSHMDNLFDIGFENFKQNLLPGLSSNDTIVFTGTEPFFQKQNPLIKKCEKFNTFKILIHVGNCINENLKNHYDIILENTLNFDTIPMLTSMSIKLIYNAITTGAHIFKGKVFKNKMIDIRISNNKLYFRCINIIKELMGVRDSTAETSLLKSIYHTDVVEKDIKAYPISKHIQNASNQEKIIPIAFLLSTGKYTYSKARNSVYKEHIVRNIIKGEEHGSI